MLGGRPRWLKPLGQRFVAKFQGSTRPRLRAVISFLLEDKKLLSRQFIIKSLLSGQPGMQPVEAALSWSIARIRTSSELADWLSLEPSELEWFADLKGWNGAAPKLEHYHYRALEKKTCGIRLIEAPKPRLKGIQQRILSEILSAVPVHQSVHGFVRGRSIRSFVAPHTGKQVLLRLDLEDFFPSISGARLQAVFRMMGYPEPVADLLGGLCSNAAPQRFGKYSQPHLPQGAPTSPALANICAFHLDRRLDGLARASGGTYTRYADDLAFSGDAEFARGAKCFLTHAAALALEEGFQVNHRKTRLMRQGVRQHLAGLTANVKPNVSREEYDILKATLHNCSRFGLASQNRGGHPSFYRHLEGRVSFVASMNPERGAKLRALLETINPDA